MLPSSALWSGVTPTAAMGAPAVKAPAVEDTVFFLTRSNGRQVLGRTDSQGHCKAYLGRADKGWLSYPDTGLDGDDLAVVSSADGQSLALISSRGGAVNLWLVSADGRSLAALTDDDGGILKAADVNAQSVAFSADGKHLAWVQHGQAWVMDLATRLPSTLSPLQGVVSVAWAPSGAWIAVNTGQSIHKIGPSGEPDFVIVPNGVKEPMMICAADPKDETIYFMDQGLRQVDSQRKITMLLPSPVQPNRASFLGGGKEVVMLAVAPGGRTEAFRGTVGAKPALTQVTLGGAEGVWGLGKNVYFLRHRVLWRCDADGSKARPLVDVPVEGVFMGSLPPLKGVCP